MQLFTPKFWADVHGGSTHFPIALLVAATVFDLAALLIRARSEERARDLQSAGFYTLLMGALVSFAAVLSGLLVVGWETLGSGALGLHHRYVWPAFGLLIAIAIWRLLVRNRASQPSLATCVAVEIVATVLMLLSGYQGGVLLQGGA